MAWEGYKINGLDQTPPDEESWQPDVNGVSLAGTQRRSGYYILEWMKNAANCNHLTWFEYDNTKLTDITTRPPDDLDDFTTYSTDVICQQVTMRHVHGAGSQVVARFLVYVG